MKRIAYFLLCALFILQACSPNPATKSPNSNPDQELPPPVVIKEPSNSSLPGAAGAGRTGATATPASLTLCAGADDTNAAAYAAEVIRLVNVERAKVGAAPLTAHLNLTQAAQKHAIDMACYGAIGHTGSDGSTPSERMDQFGYVWAVAGENVAGGYATPAAVMTGWMNSDGHRANILNTEFTDIGIGFVYNPGSTSVYYWVMDLGTLL